MCSVWKMCIKREKCEAKRKTLKIICRYDFKSFLFEDCLLVERSKGAVEGIISLIPFLILA